MQQDGQSGGHLPWRRLSWEELRFFCHELESITRAGFPMLPALSALARDMKSSRLKTVLEDLQGDLARGESLEEAIRRQGSRFPPLMLSLLRAGETTGNLTGVLALMSRHARNMCRVTQSIRTAMIYPIVLLITSAAIFGYLLVWVVPPFQETFTALGITLPWLTRAFFRASQWLRDYGAFAGMVTAFALLLLSALPRLLVSEERRRYGYGRLLLLVPWYGRVNHAILETRFSRTLHLLLSSRVPVIDALVLAGAATGNAVAECAAEDAARRAAQGERLADALAASGFFSHKLCWLLGAGEDRGGVEEALEHIADNLEREVEASEQAFGMLFAPMLTVSIAGVVGLFLLALYVPLYGAGPALGAE